MSLRSYLYNTNAVIISPEDYSIKKIHDADRGVLRTAESLIGQSVNEINKAFMDVPQIKLNIVNGILISYTYNEEEVEEEV